MSINCRNSKSIADVAQRLGGGPAFPNSPEGPPVRYRHATALKELRKRVSHEILTLRRDHGIAPSDLAVITTRATLRDDLLDPPLTSTALVRWEERDESSVVCETAHRLKGTEGEAVIVASLEPTTTHWLPEILYVAVSRPRTWLTVVGPPDTADLLGYPPQPRRLNMVGDRSPAAALASSSRVGHSNGVPRCDLQPRRARLPRSEGAPRSLVDVEPARRRPASPR